MNIGVPREIKEMENRVGLTPAGVGSLVQQGHTLLVEKEAGIGSGFGDQEYADAGAKMVDSAEEIWSAEMVCKVKEPLPEEYGYFREDLLLFTYLHLAAEKSLAQALLKSKTTALAYETVQLNSGELPLLRPMSEVAGRMSVQIGMRYLEKTYGGQGILLSGVPGVSSGNVTIIGGGVAGVNAAMLAVGLKANVTVLDISEARLEQLDEILEGKANLVLSTEQSIDEAVQQSDLLIGAVLIVGSKAPKLVSEAMVQRMKAGSVIVDIAIDQGGCIETIDRVTYHNNPIYEKHDVIHYSVGNMPGAVPRTATMSLTNATLPYATKLADLGFYGACKTDPALALGINTYGGTVNHKGVAESLGYEYSSIGQFLN